MYIDNFCYSADFSFTNLVDDGYNLVILAFMVSNVEWDCVTQWRLLGATEQVRIINYAHSKGARIIASAGGATDSPYSTFTGDAYGRSLATWAKTNNLDGVDFDLENFQMEFVWPGKTYAQMVQWVADATNAAREVLGANAIITHAPQPPYFGQHGWNDGYTEVYKKAPSINFLMVQFYNNGEQTTYESIFTTGPWTTVQSIANAGIIPLNKIVVGKPAHASDIGTASQGYNSAAQLNTMFARAKTELGWTGGVMGWQFLDRASNKAWIDGIYPPTKN